MTLIRPTPLTYLNCSHSPVTAPLYPTPGHHNKDHGIEFFASLRGNGLSTIYLVFALEAFRCEFEGPGKKHRERKANYQK